MDELIDIVKQHGYDFIKEGNVLKVRIPPNEILLFNYADDGGLCVCCHSIDHKIIALLEFDPIAFFNIIVE